MKLKHLLLLLGRLVFAGLAASATLHATANPIDTDNDGVIDELDNCPGEYGSPCFSGCPGPPGEECVTVTGTNYISGLVTCPDGSFAVGVYQCPGYAEGWGAFHMTFYDGMTGTYGNTVTFTDTDGDGVFDEDDKCKDTDGDKDFYGCEAKTYCLEVDTAYESKCLNWAAANLSHQELGSYYSGLRDFAESGCGGNGYHWACVSVYVREPITWESFGTRSRGMWWTLSVKA